MAKFDKGVEFYTTLKAEIFIHFPEKDVTCQWCPYCRAERDLGRFWCRLTNEMIYNPYIGIGDNCPLKEDNNE